MRHIRRVAPLVLIVLAAPASARQGARWAEGFEGAVFRAGSSLVVHDHGDGPAMTAFGGAAGVTLAMRRTGDAWRFLAAPPAFQANDAVSVDLGSGPRIVVAAGTEVHRDSGSAWSSVGLAFEPPSPPFTQNMAVTRSLVAWNDGGGPAVYVGGRFLSVSNVPARNVARYDGTSWSALGSGTDAEVHALAIHDDGGGTALYAVGAFADAGGIPAAYVARWSAGAWSAMPGMNAGTNITALGSFDDGSGPRLYAGGAIVLGAPTSLAAWDGSSWSPVAGAPASIGALHVHDDGGGPALFAAGASGVSRWRGGAWTALPVSAGTAVRDMASHGGVLWMTGTFAWSGPLGEANVQTWDGVRVVPAYGGLGLNREIHAARVLDVGDGPRLYAGGRFENAGGVAARGVAAFDGTVWSNLGAGIVGDTLAFARFDDGSGPKLYAGGSFLNRVARFDGTNWTPLAGGNLQGLNPAVRALESFDDGTGTQLYAAGQFTSVGATAVTSVARWNGAAWSPVGAGFTDFSTVRRLEVYDEGAGPRLFAIGGMTTSGGTPLNGVARWDGASWSAVGTIPFAAYAASCVHDDGGGPALYVGTENSRIVRRWDGANWTTVGFELPYNVLSLASHDDGTGPQLYVGLGNPAGVIGTSPCVRRWTGTAWASVAGSPAGRANEKVWALANYDDASSDPAALYVLGDFSGSETISTSVAKWSRATEDVLICVGDGSGTACPCGNASASALAAGCLNSLGLAGALRSTGTADVSNDTLVLHGSAMPGSTPALYFQGTSSVAFGQGTPFGDGLRCAAGSAIRLATVVNSGGASQVPSGPTPLSVAGAIPPGGGTRVYQAWYRNAASFCTASTFNLTNGVRISWRP